MGAIYLFVIPHFVVSYPVFIGLLRPYRARPFVAILPRAVGEEIARGPGLCYCGPAGRALQAACIATTFALGLAILVSQAVHISSTFALGFDIRPCRPLA